MWPSRAHTMAPLTNQAGKKNLNWTPEMEKAFKAMKALLAKDAISVYPNHNCHSVFIRTSQTINWVQ